MKICLIGFTYPPPIMGGHGNVMKELNEGFRKYKNDVEIYCLKNQVQDKLPNRNVGSFKNINSIDCHGSKIHRIAVLNAPLLKILHFGALLRNIVGNDRFDIYHVHIAPLAYLLNKKPLIVTAHTTTFGEAESIKKFIYFDIFTFLRYISFKTYGYLLDSIVYQKADKIIVVNDHIKDELKNIYNVSEEKIEVIYNGVDIKKFYPLQAGKEEVKNYFGIPPETFVVLYIGRLAERKNITLIIDAMEKLTDNEKIVAVIAGKGHMYKILQNTINDRKLCSKVKLLGFVEDNDLLKLYCAADIFIQPSTYEGMPLAMLEAQACSVPVISTNFKGVNNMLIDNETGFILDESSAEDLAEKIDFLFNNKNILQGMKSRCLENIRENFTMDQVIQKHLSLFEEQMKTSKSKRW